MPTVITTTRTTRTTNTGGVGGGSIKMIPIWSIKLITAILSIIILVLILILPHVMWQIHARTFILLILTCGFLLGWALPSVLRRFITFHRSDTVTYTLTAILTVLSLVLCVVYLLDNDYYSRTESYRMMVGITVCIAIEAVICCVLIAWICFGNYTIVENRWLIFKYLLNMQCFKNP